MIVAGVRRAEVVAPYESNRGHPRLTIAVIIIATVQRALREAPLRRYRQRLPCSRSLGVLQRGWGGQGRPPLRRDDAVCHSTICGGCRYRGWAEQSPAPTEGDDDGCHSTGVGGSRFGEGGTRRSRPTEGRVVPVGFWGRSSLRQTDFQTLRAMKIGPLPFGGHASSATGGAVSARPSSVTAFGRDTSCPRCGIRFPGPLGHGNRAVAWLCPRFIRRTPRALAPQSARVLAVCRWRRRRFGHSPPGGRRGGRAKNGPGWWAETVL